jgi:hypothetical protein
VRSRTQLVIAFFSAMIVALAAVSVMGRSSPGMLASVHQRESELAGRNDCSECHGGLFGSMRSACAECHAPIEAQLETGNGLHGRLAGRADQCGLCHTEHHGAGAPLVHAQSFALAGVPDVKRFDHALIGFVLDGAHLELACTECHVNADEAILPRGAQRYLGLARDCASCHEDPHLGRYSAVACTACHGQATWDGFASEGHERFLPLSGGHGDLACDACHAPESAHAFELLAGGATRPSDRECSACHASPHAPDFARGAAALAGLGPGAGCVTCHVSEHTSFHDPALMAMSAEQHAASGFGLAAPHAELECQACHSPGKNRFQARYPGRAPEACSVCHADPHGGQFAVGAFGGQECTACHAATHFEPHAFGVEEHASAALALDGAHLETECAECHVTPAEDAPRAFRGTSDRCDACHADAHAGFFDASVAELPEVAHGECAQCHETTGFGDAGAEFEHAFTGFALGGAHAESECAACHEPSAEPDATGRTFGKVHALFGAFQGCATCHADPHLGLFDARPGVPALVEGRAGCARCHVESSFRTLPRGFDHGFWTGFPLAGAHAGASCAACHAPLGGAGRDGRTAAEAAGAACSDCHEDPHAGQFAAADGASDCTRCHAAASAGFLVFDHERDARFPLGEAHAALDCAACHHTVPRDGLDVVHYRPLGRECADCHGGNAEVLLRRRSRR